MQRTGHKGHAMFRVVVQDSHRTPSSGKYVALLGSYDPHAKVVSLKKDRAEFYLDHGAQPSDRVIRLFEQEGVTLPNWVQRSAAQKGAIRNPEKLRKNQPAAEVVAEEPVEASKTESTEQAVEAPAAVDEKATEPEA